MKPIAGVPPVLDKASGSHTLTGCEITAVEPYDGVNNDGLSQLCLSVYVAECSYRLA